MKLEKENKRKIIEIIKDDENIFPAYVWDDPAYKRSFPFVYMNYDRVFSGLHKDLRFGGIWTFYEFINNKDAHRLWPDIYPNPEPKCMKMESCEILVEDE